MTNRENNYFVWDGVNGELEDFPTVEKAQEFIIDEFADAREGIHPDIESVFIMQRILNTVVEEEEGNVKFIEA